MSSAAFERIAREHRGLAPALSKLQRFLSKQDIGEPFRLERAAAFSGISVPDAATLLQLLPGEIAAEKTYALCPHCQIPIDGEGDPIECDACGEAYAVADLDKEQCWFVKEPIRQTLIETGVAMQQVRQNPLVDSERRRLSRCAPWSVLDPHSYLVEVTQLGDEEESRILGCVERFGICHIRWSGSEPSHSRLRSLESGIGPARDRQNDFLGKIKRIVPDIQVKADTGNSAKELLPHVDGTQHERTPALLVFQYEFRPQFGGHSTFIDLTHVLSQFPAGDLHEITVRLARKDCATFSKKGMTYTGPIVRTECQDQSVSLRLRFDDVVHVHSDCQSPFNSVRDAVLSLQQKLIFKPREGDIVVFDNWRVLHGREEVGGRNQRLHDRMWIDSLRSPHDTRFLLGVRPLSVDLMAAIKAANQ